MFLLVGLAFLAITQALAQAPAITSVSPAAGSSLGGTVVTIAGSNFVNGAGLQVQFGLNNATSVTFVSATQITATTPPATSQANDSVVGVTVVSGDAQQAFLAKAFSYHLPPSISSVSPISGPSSGGNQVQIVGQNFRGLPSVPTVMFGATAATNVIFNGGTKLTVTAPAESGTVSVVVTDADQQSASLPNSYTYFPAPTIVSVSPAAGSGLGGTSVAVRGTNFVNGASLQVQFGVNAATRATFVNSTQITAVTPAASNLTNDSVVGVTVVSGDGQQAFLPQAYNYHLPPSISSVYPSAGPVGGGNQVVISGNNFRGLPAAPVVTFGGVVAPNTVFNNGSTLTVTVPAGLGTVAVVVTDADGQSVTLPNAYTYGPGPTISSISPAAGPSIGGASVTIMGANFINGPGLQVQFGLNAATQTTFVSANELTAITPAASNEANDSTVGVTIINGTGQQVFLPQAYNYHLAPSIASLTPNFGPTSGFNKVQINGTNFRGLPQFPTVTFGGVPATDVVFHNGNTITAVAPPAKVNGAVSVVVNDADGQSVTFANGYIYSGKYNIGGRITSSGLGLQSVTVTLSDGSFTTTDISGNYAFVNVQGGGNYTVAPSLAGFNFSPPSLTVFEVGSNLTTLSFTASNVTNAQWFVPVTPCRVADTRNPAGPFGGPGVAANSSRDFTIPGSACGVPPSATAYSLNVAAVPSGPLGNLVVWPAGQNRPLTSTLSSSDGRVKGTAAIVPAGSAGAISVFATDTTHVVLDINGYFVPASANTGFAFYPVTPCRLVDTRLASSPLGGPSLSGTRSFPLLSGSCNIPASAAAYSLNFAAVPDGPLGYITAWATGKSQPLVSTLNAPTGTVTANAAIVPAGNGGAIDVFTTDKTDLVIDVNGYFAPAGAGGLSFYRFAPCRVLDTRASPGSQAFAGELSVDVVGGTCAVPATSQAYVFNVTAAPQGLLGFLTLWPQGQAQPLVSTLNALDGATTSNMAIVPTTNGSINVFADGYTQLVLDFLGYFAP
jgi:hypothetical protein